ncbi:SpoVR family protein [Bordetella bronchiseptica]|uniref:SpoVR family protein n=1 Tax=Bordetella bronchiseptica TaxID=518 RepID=UPI0004D526A9|nr:SpoVR family protein [Bordetella bronchiseptica]AXT87604.1 SpoVR family protein [Bordetella bronchiseptica]KDS77019.1 SpoVR family protein [Bordetella bronchiseptica KM22]
MNAITGGGELHAVGRAQPISEGSEWTFELIQRYDEAISEIAREYRLDTYPNQIEVITSEQMLDAYASAGLPIGYPHWSYGKEFIRNEQYYRKGMQGLAYEIVINSSPCIAYLMEENSMAMQALVIAHACYGHNSFFKGNYLFRQWTDADSILDYLVFARKYVMDCEDRYGIEAVEAILDSCHALAAHGVDRYKRPTPISYREEAQRQAEREEHARRQYNDLWRTVPRQESPAGAGERRAVFPPEPEENLLYFIEKYAPKLEPWQKELVRIVRKIAQYFYPQGHTKVMNEGWATFWHYTLLNRLHQKGRVTDGFMIEVLQSHTNVVSQRGFDERGYGGVNPYALGFSMMQDIRRICERPDEEDRRWFPDIAGSDWLTTLDFAMRNFKDESFISQYLSPRLIREFRFFAIADHQANPKLEVAAIHDDEGYRQIRKLLAAQHNRDNQVPDIQVVRYFRESDRALVLRHQQSRGRPLAGEDADKVMKHLARLWGFRVRLEEAAPDGTVLSYRQIEP